MPGTRKTANWQRIAVNAYQPIPIADPHVVPVDAALLYPRVKGPKDIIVGNTAQTFAFQLDDDLTKLVSLIPNKSILRVVVRYATDVVVQQDSYELPASTTPTVTADSQGIIVRWQARLLPRLPWPLVARKRRF
ncbi:hypothetical protein [Devosia sp.]|uniref:hypothetical protein n=1 Tax=Devosia sp. TaxID=1871048 RepID=UPI003BAB5BCC